VTTAQSWIVGSLIFLLLSRLVAAIQARQNVAETLLNFGIPAALSAAAGGLAVLTHKAETLRGVNAISGDAVLSGSDSMRVGDLTDLGDRLLADELCVYGVFVILIGTLLWELTIGRDNREKSPSGVGWLAYVGLGFAVPAFLGAGALYIVYTRT
jgi:hypothetical protein